MGAGPQKKLYSSGLSFFEGEQHLRSFSVGGIALQCFRSIRFFSLHAFYDETGGIKKLNGFASHARNS